MSVFLQKLSFYLLYYFFLLFIAFEEIIIIFLVVLISTFIFYLIFYKKIKNFGALRKKFDLKKTNLILETLKGIKEIKIYKRERNFEKNYNINNELIYIFWKKILCITENS